MKNNKGVTLVALIVTIIVLIILAGISINLILGDNGIITIAKKAKENTELAKIEEETKVNELYTQIETEEGTLGGLSYDAIAKLIEFRKKIATAITNEGVETKESDTADVMAENIGKIKNNVVQERATVTEDKILKDYTAYKDGKLIVGTMANNGAVNIALNAGESYTIVEGYHNGSGIITANSLESQTQATATAADILQGKTAYVNGSKVTGTSSNEGTWRLGLTLQIGYNSTGYAKTTFSPICDVTLKDGNLTISYVNENYQTVNIIGKTISVDPCSPMTITKIK